MSLHYELQSIISGAGKHSTRNLIEAAAHHLRESKKTSGNTQETEFTKGQETAKLIHWIEESSLWFSGVDESRYMARGAEQRVYLDEDVRYVIKLNDSIFYAYWLDYFHSLLIHNFLFPKTAYDLIGFCKEKNILYAVVRQPFIEITEPTDPLVVKDFLLANGFKLKKDCDYFNPTIGIILEDLHDENVLTNKGALFFIDTVFYLTPSFFT
jgi:hypothetical protein